MRRVIHAYNSRIAQGLYAIYTERDDELKQGDSTWSMVYRSLSPEIPQLLNMLDCDEGAQEGTAKFLHQLGDIVKEEPAIQEKDQNHIYAQVYKRLEESIAKLRTIDCVNISLCYEPHGDAIFVELGEGENQRIVGSGCGNTLEALLSVLEEASSI